MKFVKVLSGLVIGYIAGALIGGVLVEMVSTNAHDKAQEVATTALIVTGPIGAILGVGIGMLWAAKS